MENLEEITKFLEKKFQSLEEETCENIFDLGFSIDYLNCRGVSETN